jgi:hypothetical protein
MADMAMEIFQRGGFSFGVEDIRRATICNARQRRWLTLERVNDETEDSFMRRVRTLCNKHGGHHVVWNPMAEPEDD